MKRGLLLIFLFAVKLSWAQSPSNDCSTAAGQQHSISTSCSYTSWDINTGIGSPALSNCSGSNSGSRDGWSWFNGNGSTVTVSYDPPNNRNAAIYIYTDGGTACSGLTQIACADAGGDNFAETVNVATTAGTRYYVRVVRRSGSSGTMGGQICVWSCPAPSNDNPCGATSLTVNTSCTLSSYTLNSCATSSSVANPSCNNTSVNDIWYSLTVPSSGRITFQTTAGTITDADMALYSVSGGCSGTFTQLYCDDNSGPSAMPQITAVGLTPGSTVYLRVWARDNLQTGNFNLCAFDPCSTSPGGNDNACGATPLTVGSSCTLSSYTLGACSYPSSVANPSCNNITVNDIWFSAVVPSSGKITIQTTSGGITDLDLALYSATACAGVFTELYCDDQTGPGSMPEITATGLTAGSTVYLRAWARNNAQTGTFNLCAFDPCSTLPSNDNPCGATSLSVPSSCSLTSYTLSSCATSSAVANPTCNNISVNDIWFSAVVPASGNLTIETTSGGITDLDLALYSATACAGVFTQLYCDNNTGPGSMPEITATGLTPGTTVYIRAWARNNAQTGTFNLCAYEPCSTPANDDPCGATALPVNSSCAWGSPYTTNCASSSGGIPAPGCASYNGNDVWFSITVPASGTVQIDTKEGDITDGGMAVYSATGCAGTFTLIACDDDASSNGFMPYLSLTGQTPGATLYIRFWAYNNDEAGTFQICITDPCSSGAPSNDDPCSAVVITPATSCSYATYNNNCATATGGGIPAPGCANYVTGDVWFAVTVPASGGLSIDTKQGTLTDMGMALYSATACSGTYTLVACDDDASTNGFMPYLSVTSLTPGDVVYIRMWDKGGDAQGTFDICVTDPCPNGIPTNDLPCDAQELTIGVTLFGDNGCATNTNDPATPACWTAGNSNTVWFYVVAPASGTIKLRTYLNTLVNSQMALFSGTCSSLTLVACNEDATPCAGSTPVYHSELNVTGLTPGQTYYVAVDGSSNYMGSFNIVATDGSAFNPIPQQDCIYPTLICNQITTVGNPGFVGAGNVCDYTTPYSCYGGGERNSVWYYFNVQSAGTLTFGITPSVSSTDYDFMLFNVGTSTFSTVCSAISAKTQLPVRCNFSGTTGVTGLFASATGTHENASGPNKCSPLAVAAGDKYLLLITNYSNNNTGFTLDFNSSSPLNYTSTPTSIVWTGGIDNDWFKPGNWGGCAIPSCTIDAVVVNGPINQPVINGSGAVTKSLTIQPGANLTLQGNNTLQICGDYTNSGDLNANVASTIYFGPGTATQTINGSLVGLSQFPNLRVQKTGGQVILNQDIDIAGNITVNTSGPFSINGKYLKLKGNFYNNLGSTSFVNPEGSTLEFAGLVPQTFNNGSGSLTLGSVRVDNKSTGVTLSGSTSSLITGLTGTLDLNDGVIITANNNEVNVTNSTPTAINTGNINSYVRGRLRRNIGTTTGNYYFPVGNAAIGYELAEINYTTPPTSTYNLLATFTSWGVVPNGPISSDCSGRNYAIKPALNHGYWTINASVSPASGTYNVTLNNQGYTNNSGTFWTVMKRSPSGSSGTWALDGTCNTSSTADITIREGLSGFSDFASIQWANPLPIELLSFYVEKADNAVSCKWTTVSEENNDYFTVERTMDKINFEEIGKVDGAGNSKELNNYSYTDKNPLAGLSYYRIRQTDFNGHSTTTEWKSVDFNTSPSHLNLFPNPASKFINCAFTSQYKGLAEISVIDINQKELIRYRAEMITGQNRIPISIESIPNGVYFIKLKSAEYNKPYFEMSAKFIKGKGIK